MKGVQFQIRTNAVPGESRMLCEREQGVDQERPFDKEVGVYAYNGLSLSHEKE